MADKAYSNSELQSWKNCPLQHHFFYDLALRPIDDEASDHHLRFGNAFHAGLEQLYRGNGLPDALRAMREGYPVQLDLNDRAKTQENGCLALCEYVQRWREEDLKWRVLEVETHSEDEAWSVKPDMIVENIEHGGIYLIDNKTTGKYLDYNYWGQFNPNSQITHYLDYAQSKYGDDVAGFYINAISFRFRERKWKDEPAGFWCKFERQLFNRRPEMIQQERESRESWIRDIQHSKDEGFWRTNTGACRFCSFKPICAAGWTWESDEELIRIQYRQACQLKDAANKHCVLDLDHEDDCSSIRQSSLLPSLEEDIVVEV